MKKTILSGGLNKSTQECKVGWLVCKIQSNYVHKSYKVVSQDISSQTTSCFQALKQKRLGWMTY